MATGTQFKKYCFEGRKKKEGRKKEREGMSERSGVGSGSVGAAPTCKALCMTKTFVLRALVAHSCPNSL